MDEDEQQFPSGYRGVLPISTVGRGAIDFRAFPDARRLRDLTPVERARYLAPATSPSLLEIMKADVEEGRRRQEQRKTPKKPESLKGRGGTDVPSDQPTDLQDATGLSWKIQL